MTDSPPAAIRAHFVDYKTAQGRGAFRLIIEVPEAEGKKVLETLGTPTSDTPIPVAVALIKSEWERKLDGEV